MATALPAISSFTDSSVTEAGFKTALTDLRTYLATLLGTDGENQTALKALGSIFHTYEYKTAAYSVTTSDNGKLFAINGAYTVTTPDSTATSNGFTFAVAAISGTVTIDGYSTQTVDGSASVTLAAGESCFVLDDGSNWRTFGKTTTFTISDNSIIADKFVNVATGGYLLTSPTDWSGVNTTSYTKKQEIIIGREGTYKVRMWLKSSITTYGRIYVNGVARGTERSTTNPDGVYWDENITVNNGDRIELYIKGSTTGLVSIAGRLELYGNSTMTNGVVRML